MSRRKGRFDFAGESLTALCGGALALNLLLVMGLLVLVGAKGLGYFWQRPLVLFDLEGGEKVLGEIHGEETIPMEAPGGGGTRIKIKTGNRDLTGADFRWIDSSSIASRSLPPGAILLERLEWGNFYGSMIEIRSDDRILASGPEDSFRAIGPLFERKVEQREAIRTLEKRDIGEINRAMEQLRLEERRLQKQPDGGDRARRLSEIQAEQARLEGEYHILEERLQTLRSNMRAEVVVMEASDGARKEITVGSIARVLRPNEMSGWNKARLYLSRLREFVLDDPRESNTEGGIFPAIFGTVMMVFLMSFAVAPLGVLAALFLREYARQGPLVRIVRIAVNNLAGVPSIVFGVFGLGFFVYLIGGSIDAIFHPEALPTPTYGTGGILWASLTLALLTVPVVIVATEEGLASVPRVVREGSLALGATKFETTLRVVLPAAAPGVLTGMILAMARAAGEVAPLMIVGMVKLAPSLPVDGDFPFVHLERKFMHLGFHIYDVGFQSPNVDAAKPLVFATSLLLILVVTAMNLAAILIRNHLRRRYASSAV